MLSNDAASLAALYRAECPHATSCVIHFGKTQLLFSYGNLVGCYDSHYSFVRLDPNRTRAATKHIDRWRPRDQQIPTEPDEFDWIVAQCLEATGRQIMNRFPQGESHV